MQNEYEINFDAKKFISLKQAALVSGYAKDYIGYLCRNNKIAAKRVGRDWFVDPDNLISYKQEIHGKQSTIFSSGSDVLEATQIVRISTDLPITDQVASPDTTPAKTVSLETTTLSVKKAESVIRFFQERKTTLSDHDKWDSLLLQDPTASAAQESEAELVTNQSAAVGEGSDLFSAAHGRHRKSFSGPSILLRPTALAFVPMILVTILVLHNPSASFAALNRVGHRIYAMASDMAYGFRKAAINFDDSLHQNADRFAAQLSRNVVATNPSSLVSQSVTRALTLIPDYYSQFNSDIRRDLSDMGEYASRQLSAAMGVWHTAIRVPEHLMQHLTLRFSETYHATKNAVRMPDIRLTDFRLSTPGLNIGRLNWHMSGLKLAAVRLPDIKLPDLSFPNLNLPDLRLTLLIDSAQKVFSNFAESVSGFIDIVHAGGVQTVKQTTSDISAYLARLREQLAHLAIIVRERFTGITQREPVTYPLPQSTSTAQTETRAGEAILTSYDLLRLKNAVVADLTGKGLIVERTVEKPTIIERTLERIISGVTQENLDEELSILNNKILLQISDLKNQIASRTQENFQAIALTNKIDNLSSPTISSPSISGTATFSGAISGTSATFTGNLTSGGLLSISGSGTSTIAGNLNVSGSLEVGGTCINCGGGFSGGALSATSINNTGNTTLGDATTTDIVYVNSRFASSLVPTADNALDIGDGTNWLRWRTGYFGTSVGIGGIATSTGTNLLASGAYTINSAGTLSLNTTNNQNIVTGTGKFGIGTSTPYAKLTVWGSGTTTDRTLEIANNASTTLLTVLDNGNVGIATSSPYAKLSVSGDVAVDGKATASYFTATSTGQASTLPYASSTAITISGTASTTDLVVSNISTFKNLTASNATTTNATTTSLAVLATATTTDLIISGNATLSKFTAGSVVFSSTGGLLAQDNTNFFWDNSAKRLTLPYASTTALTVSGTASTTNLTVSSLIAGRIPFITTGSSFTDSGALTWNSTASRLTSTYASSTALSATNADFATLTLTNPLSIASGGTGASSFTTSGNAVYYSGTTLATAPLTSAITIPYASTTALTVSGTASTTNLVMSSMTSGSVLFAGTDGLLSQNNANLAWNNSATRLSFPYASTTALTTSGGAWFATNGGNVGIGTTTPGSTLAVHGNALISNTFSTANLNATGTIAFAEAARTSGTTPYLTLTGGADTGLTAGAEVPDIQWNLARTKTHTNNTISLQRDILINAATHAFTNWGAGLITDLATVGITGAPLIGTNATTTNAHTLYLGASTLNASTTNSYGLTVNANTGATNNYAATFLGGNVGVGTTSPFAKLSVAGSGFFNDALTASNITATGTLSVTGTATLSNTLSVTNLSTLTGGFISSASSSIAGPLTVSGTLNASSTIVVGNSAFTRISGDNLASVIPYASTTALTVSGTASTTNLVMSGMTSGSVLFAGTDGLLSQNNANFSWNDTATRLSFPYASTTALTTSGGAWLATNGGNVGIGTTTPWAQLSLNPNGIAGPAFAVGSSTQTNFVITNGGYVGIGTTSPSSTLSVSGNINVTGTTTLNGVSYRWPASDGLSNQVLATNGAGQLSWATQSGTGAAYDWQKETNFGVLTLTPTTTIPIWAKAPIYASSTLTVNGTASFNSITATSTLNVTGLTTLTYASSTALTVSNSAYFATSGGGVGVGTTSPWGLLSINPNALGAGVPSFVIGSSTATSFIVDNGGSVGIGTTTPNNTLTVSKTTAGDAIAWSNEAASAKTGYLYSSSNFVGMFMAAGGAGTGVALSSSALSLYSPSQAQSLTLTSTGVGIGTTTPSEALEVNGGITVTGASYGKMYDLSGLFRIGARSNISQAVTDASGGYVMMYPANAASGVKGNLYLGAGDPGTPATGESQIRFFTNNAQQMVIDSAGLVGIGTTTPGASLNVRGANPLWLDSTASNQIKLLVNETAYGQIFANSSYELGITNAAGSANHFVMNSSGNVGVATLAAAAANHICYDTTTLSGFNTLATCSSLRQYKDNIVDLTVGTDVLMQLKPVSYDWKSTGEHYYGFIAEDVYAVDPLLASYYQGQLNGVNYDAVTSLLVKSVQEINQKISMAGVATTSPSIFIDASGSIGVGTTTPAYKLHVAGDVAATGFVNVSTREAKKDIVFLNEAAYDSALEKIINTDVATYNYKNEECADRETIGGSATCAKRLGLIAEQAPVEVLSPDHKGVDLYKMTAFLWSGVKAQQKQIESLELRVSELETRVAQMAAVTAISAESGVASSSGLSVEGIAEFLRSVGTSISNGIVQATEFIANKVTARKVVTDGLEMTDSVTGEVYCVRISNGDWNKFKGTCGEYPVEPVSAPAAPSAPTTETATTSTTTTAAPATTASSTPTVISTYTPADTATSTQTAPNVTTATTTAAIATTTSQI